MDRKSVSLLAAAAALVGIGGGSASIEYTTPKSMTYPSSFALPFQSGSFHRKNQRQRRKRWAIQRSNGRAVR